MSHLSEPDADRQLDGDPMDEPICRCGNRMDEGERVCADCEDDEIERAERFPDEDDEAAWVERELRRYA